MKKHEEVSKTHPKGRIVGDGVFGRGGRQWHLSMDRVSRGDAERDEKTQARLASLNDIDLYRWDVLRGRLVPRRAYHSAEYVVGRGDR